MKAVSDYLYEHYRYLGSTLKDANISAGIYVVSSYTLTMYGSPEISTLIL